MATPEARALELLRSRRSGNDTTTESPEAKALALLRVGRVAQEIKSEEDDGRSDVLQAGAGVLEGILDPLSVIPFVDRKLQQLEEYRGDETAGRIGYGVGAIGGFFLPYAPANLALRAGTAAARGLKLTKAVENTEDVVALANRMTQLSWKGEAVQGMIAGGLATVGMPVEEGESRALNTIRNTVFGGIADVALTPIWRAVSGIAKASKTLPPEVTDLVQQTLKTGAEDNAPVVANARVAGIVGRALTLADNVLSNPDVESKAEMGLNIARALGTIEEGSLRIIPAVGRNHTEFTAAIKSQGFDIIETTPGVEEGTSFLIGPAGSLEKMKGLVEEFSHYGFVKGQSVKVKGEKGTIVGLGDKKAVKVLIPGKGVKEFEREDMLLLPIAVTKSVSKSIGKASNLWGDFLAEFEKRTSNDTLAEEVRRLGIALDEKVEGPERLSFDGAFEKFAAEKKIDGANKTALKDYFLKRHEEEISKFAKEEVEILRELRKANKGWHPEGHLEEAAVQRGYVVKKVMIKKKVHWSVRDASNAQAAVFVNRSDALKFVQDHQRDIPSAHAGQALPVSEDLLNTGGVGVGSDAGYEGMISPEAVSKLRGSVAGATATRLRPRAQELRRFEEIVAKDGKNIPLFTEVFDPLSRLNVAWQNRKAPYFTMLARDVVGRWTRNIRPEKYNEFVEFIESGQKSADIARLGLTDREVKAAQGFKKLTDEIWEKEGASEYLGMSAKDYIEWYFPRMREFAADGAAREGETFKDYLRREAIERGFKANEKSIEFFNDLQRTGQLGMYEKNPIAVMTRYINGITFKSSGAHDGYQKSIAKFNEIVDVYGDDPDIAPWLAVTRDYTRLLQGQTPEQVGTITGTYKALFEKTGMSKHLDDEVMERFTNVWVGLNHGAFLGFRLAKSVINAAQIGHIYMKDGAKYTAKGIRSVMFEAGQREAIENGAVVVSTPGRLPYADQIQAHREEALSATTTGIGKMIDAGLTASQIGGKLFGLADEYLRGIAYHSQKARAIDAFNKYGKFDRNLKFEEEAGLTAMGEAVTQGYFKVLRDSGNEAAAKWLGVRSANDTQWMYQRGAGPIAFSKGPMKLFGQYGSWAMWYADFAKRGLTVGTTKDKIKFAYRGAAFSGALVGIGYATGVDTTRWHGPSSVFYAGGPLWDKVKDASTVWGGLARPGGMPLEAELVASEYGVKYDEDLKTRFRLDMPEDDPTKGARKMFTNTVGMAVPGTAALRDVEQGVTASGEGQSAYHSWMLALGFDMQEDE